MRTSFYDVLKPIHGCHVHDLLRAYTAVLFKDSEGYLLRMGAKFKVQSSGVKKGSLLIVRQGCG